MGTQKRPMRPPCFSCLSPATWATPSQGCLVAPLALGAFATSNISAALCAGNFFKLVSFAAVWVAASLLQEPASVWLGLYVLAWYGADFTAARALGWPSTARSLMALPLRDLLLLSIWIGAWTGRSFTWHGNAMTANRQSEPQG
jgi:hypothetical protein